LVIGRIQATRALQPAILQRGRAHPCFARTQEDNTFTLLQEGSLLCIGFIHSGHDRIEILASPEMEHDVTEKIPVDPAYRAIDKQPSPPVGRIRGNTVVLIRMEKLSCRNSDRIDANRRARVDDLRPSISHGCRLLGRWRWPVGLAYRRNNAPERAKDKADSKEPADDDHESGQPYRAFPTAMRTPCIVAGDPFPSTLTRRLHPPRVVRPGMIGPATVRAGDSLRAELSVAIWTLGQGHVFLLVDDQPFAILQIQAEREFVRVVEQVTIEIG